MKRIDLISKSYDRAAKNAICALLSHKNSIYRTELELNPINKLLGLGKSFLLDPNNPYDAAVLVDHPRGIAVMPIELHQMGHYKFNKELIPDNKDGVVLSDTKEKVIVFKGSITKIIWNSDDWCTEFQILDLSDIRRKYKKELDAIQAEHSRNFSGGCIET